MIHLVAEDTPALLLLEDKAFCERSACRSGQGQRVSRSLHPRHNSGQQVGSGSTSGVRGDRLADPAPGEAATLIDLLDAGALPRDWLRLDAESVSGA